MSESTAALPVGNTNPTSLSIEPAAHDASRGQVARDAGESPQQTSTESCLPVENETVYRTVVELSQDGIWAVDAHYRTTYVNARLAQMLGYAPAEMLGREVADFMPDNHRDDFRAKVRERRAGVSSQYEACYRKKNGADLWVIVSATPIMDDRGSFRGAVAVLTDISERRLTEEALTHRAAEQAALYKFTDRMQRTASSEEIYDAALHSIKTALGCDRASILLMDSSATMRFVAWSGLSDEYRSAVDGHSVWKADDPDPAPIYFADVEQADLAPELKETVLKEGIRALAFIPLAANCQLLG